MTARFKGRLVNASVGIQSGKPQITLETDETISGDILDEIAKGDISIEIKPYRAKRSLDANAYCWVLLDKLSATLKIPKTEIYRILIRDIGGNSEVICVMESAADKLCDGWMRNGIGWQTERFPSKLPGCVNVILYYGSSTYDSAQMSALIDRIVEECKLQNIPTATPDEIENMKSLWESAERASKWA